jgi:hypothetical protein
MAKKVVATLKGANVSKSYSKVIRTSRSEKTGAYVFKEEIIESELVQEFLAKK